jgi:hypothetical protein
MFSHIVGHWWLTFLHPHNPITLKLNTPIYGPKYAESESGDAEVVIIDEET